jgi:hypothetical protein
MSQSLPTWPTRPAAAESKVEVIVSVRGFCASALLLQRYASCSADEARCSDAHPICCCDCDQ